MLARLRKFMKDESGASAVEYALLVAGIAVVAMVAIFALGGVVSDKFDEIGNQISGTVIR
ncbi:MAG: Flp family type IVb pilin [Candidatus Nanopelagicales bacterium]|jgi:pilus assembly protein Flp/PilA